MKCELSGLPPGQGGDAIRDRSIRAAGPVAAGKPQAVQEPAHATCRREDPEPGTARRITEATEGGHMNEREASVAREYMAGVTVATIEMQFHSWSNSWLHDARTAHRESSPRSTATASRGSWCWRRH